MVESENERQQQVMDEMGIVTPRTLNVSIQRHQHSLVLDAIIL
jgi:hypothetical protein